MKKILSLFILLFVFFAGIQYVDAATASTRLVASKTSVLTSQTATIRVVIDASSRIRGGQFNLSINNSNFEVVSVTGANGLSISSNGNLYLAYRVEADYSISSGSAIATITVRAKSSTVGATSTITVSNVGITLLGSYDTISAGSKSITLSIAKPAVVVTKSSNNTLSTLSSTTANLNFNANTTTYSVTVPSNTTTFDVNAVAQDSKATLSVTGNTNLKTGNNVVLIKVTAEDGTTKTYTINVTKEASTNNLLSSLTINGYDLDPTFDKDTTKYDVTINDTSVTELDISAVAEDSKSKVEIIGNEDLMEGRNIIKVMVTSESGETKTYSLIANITSGATTSEDSNITLIIFTIVALILSIFTMLAAIFYIKKRKQSV